MQKGRSMIEMLGVLAIAALLSMGALAGWSQARKKMNLSKTQNEIAVIAQDTASLYAWARGYAPLTMGTLCDEGVIDRCKNDKSAGINPFGGDYEVAATDGGNTFTITVKDLPTGVCEELKEGYDYPNLADEANNPKCNNGNFVAKFQ